MLPIFINFLITVFVIVSALMVLIVLMQRPKSEGLGAAFGGGMTENLFGAQTTNVLANFTRWLGALFFGIALLLSVLYARLSTQRSSIQEEALRHAAPVVPAASPTASPAVSVPTRSAAPALPLPTASVAASPFSEKVKLLAPAASPSEELPAAPSLNGTGAAH